MFGKKRKQRMEDAGRRLNTQTARFDSTCQTCPRRIQEGDPIVRVQAEYEGGKKKIIWVCQTCGSGAPITWV